MSDLEPFLPHPAEAVPAAPTVAVYARVSTKKQADAGNLERQRRMEYAVRRGYRVALEVADVGSGLNPRRRGLRRLIRAAEEKEFQILLIEYPDRVARFGYEYLAVLFRVLGVTVTVTSAQVPEDAETELVRDLLAVVTSFSARLYGARGGRRVRHGLRSILEEVERSAEDQGKAKGAEKRGTAPFHHPG